MTGTVDPKLYALTADALAGRRVGRRRATEVAAQLRALLSALPPATPIDHALARELAGAADVLDAQAAAPHHRR